MTNNTPADWCDYESGHQAHIDFRAFHERYCPGDLEPQSPLWCPILVPHDAQGWAPPLDLTDEDLTPKPFKEVVHGDHS